MRTGQSGSQVHLAEMTTQHRFTPKTNGRPAAVVLSQGRLKHPTTFV
jgi:hypothetical protein